MKGRGDAQSGWMGLMAHLAGFYTGMTEILKRSVDYDLIEDEGRLAMYLSVLHDDCVQLSSEVTGGDFLVLSDREKEMDVIARYLVAMSMAFVHLRAIYGDEMMAPLVPLLDGPEEPEEEDGPKTEIGAREAEERFLKEYMEAYSKQDTEFLSLSVDEWLDASGLVLRDDSDSGPAGKPGAASGPAAGKPSGRGAGGRRVPRARPSAGSVEEAVSSDSGSGR